MSLLAIALLGLGPALAGPLPLELSPGARVEVLPAQAGRVDVLVHDNSVDLRGQVAALHHPSLRTARATDTGTDWVLSFNFRDRHTGVRVGEGGLEVVALPAPVERPRPARELSASVGEVPQAEACAAAPVPIAVLSLSQARWADPAVVDALSVPTWGEAEPTGGGWHLVDEAREALASGSAPRARTLYRLGALHRDLGHLREAAWYFGEAALAGGDAGASHLQRAAALVKVGHLEPATRAARSAVDAGASPASALHVVALAAWLQRDADAAAYAQVLAENAATPGASLLAGVVLAGTGCHDAAATTLAAVLPSLPAAPRAVAMMALAEAHLVGGDYELASKALSRIPPVHLPAEARPLLRERVRVAALAPRTPLSWPDSVPDFRREADDPGPGGAESLFVLGQLYAASGEDREAIGSLAELVRRYPHLAVREPGEALVALWARRTAELLASGREIDAVLLHRGAWDDALLVHLDDLGPLEVMAAALADQGFPDQALLAWRAVAEAREARGLPSHHAVLALARLFVETGANADGLDAIQWLRRHHADPGWRGELADLEAKARQPVAGSPVTDCSGVDATVGSGPAAICAKINEEESEQKAFVAALSQKTVAAR